MEASTFNASAHLINLDKVLYGKVESFSSTPKSGIEDSIPKDWIKFDYSKSDDPTSKCQDTSKALDGYLSNNLYEKLPVKDTKFLGLASFDGAQGAHYSGALDATKLQAVIDEANKGVEKDCQTEFKAEELKDITITYELFRGFDKDRLIVFVKYAKAKVDTTVTLDTSAYDKPVSVKAPAGAKDIKDLLGGEPLSFASARSLALGQSNSAVLGASTKADAATRDEQRKAALSIYASAYKAAAVKGVYPLSAPVLTNTVSDPSTKAPYAVSNAAPTAIGQIQYQPGGVCTGRNHTPGKAGSRYLALSTLLETGSSYCLDVK
jgi:hypothetical protein